MNDNRAFTLLELLLGTVFIVLVLLPLYGLITQNTQGVEVNIDETDAVNATTCILEALQALPFNALIPLSVDGGSSGVSLETMPPSFLESLNLPRLPHDKTFFVLIERKTVQNLTMAADWSDEERSAFCSNTYVWAICVTCCFKTRSLGEAVGRTRYREISLATIVSRATRG